MNAHLSPIGTAIRTARLSKGIKQCHAAKLVGVSPSALNQWKNGESGISVANLFKIAALLEIDLSKAAEVRAAVDSLHSPELTVGTFTKFTDLRDEIETAYDLMTALDKTGDGIGGDVGHGVSAVALAARAALDNARDMLRAVSQETKSGVM